MGMFHLREYSHLTLPRVKANVRSFTHLVGVVFWRAKFDYGVPWRRLEVP
jgi:hypothetical protein